AMMPRIARTVVSVWMRTSEDLTRRRSATAGPPRRVNCGELCFTLNYHLSTLNFLSTAASGWLQQLVRCWRRMGWNRIALSQLLPCNISQLGATKPESTISGLSPELRKDSSFVE